MRGLRSSAGLVALLVALPALALWLFPRGSARGLDRLLLESALLQTHRSRPADPPPSIWRDRLGSQAAPLWSSRQQLWWQLWSSHASAGAVLVLETPASAPLPANAFRVDQFTLVAPNPLVRQQLEQQLQLERPSLRGLERRCALQLQRGDAVYWSAAGLSSLLGPLAPLASSLQQGCLTLSSEGSRLLWSGEADAARGSLAAAPRSAAAPNPERLVAPTLLELQGPQLELVLRGLLSSAALKQALADRYGIKPDALKRLSQSPFVLSLSALNQGSFLAGLQLQLRLRDGQAFWAPRLKALEQPLIDQGLSVTRGTGQQSLWSRDGVAQGGWRWLSKDQLLLFLGPAPGSLKPARLEQEVPWSLRLQPKQLQAKGLLPPLMPVVVRRARELVLRGVPSRGGQTALSGELTL